MAGNSERLKGTKKGGSRLPEVLVNNVYFCRKGAQGVRNDVYDCIITNLF